MRCHMDTYRFSKVADRVRLLDGTRFYGVFDQRINALISGLFTRVDMGAVVDFYRYRLNRFAAGEFFGKLMRAACLVYRYTKNAELKNVIDGAAADLMSLQDGDGDISTAPKAEQPNGSSGADLWERKYVLLGLWEYYLATEDEKALDCMTRLALYTASQVGDPPKTPVTNTGWAFCGIESSSILEPVVRLYALTGREELFRLASHIVSSGACGREDMFAAIMNGKAPKDIGSDGVPEHSIAKAYEMMSCFEGLLEFYRVTGEEKHLLCARKFIERINEREITYLGSGGADGPYNLGPGTGEQWNDTFFEQANPDIKLSMETCVTITYMKLMLQYYRLTGDASCIDRIEVSAYNALLGAMKPDGTFFDYFPKFNGTRSTKVNFSYYINGIPLSCCTANGPMGLAILPFFAYCMKGDALAVNLYIPSENAYFRMETEYPLNGVVTLVSLFDGELPVALRIPGFCDSFTLSEKYKKDGGYAVLEKKTWKKGDRVTLSLDMPLVCHPCPPSVNPEASGQVLFTYGPLVLARDKSVDPGWDQPVRTVPGTYDGYEIKDGRLRFEDAVFVPYPNAGASWDDSTEYKCWLRQV